MIKRGKMLHIKELELRECKLSIQLKINELEVAKTATSSAGKLEKFDISNYISTFTLSRY